MAGNASQKLTAPSKEQPISITHRNKKDFVCRTVHSFSIAVVVPYLLCVRSALLQGDFSLPRAHVPCFLYCVHFHLDSHSHPLPVLSCVVRMCSLSLSLCPAQLTAQPTIPFFSTRAHAHRQLSLGSPQNNIDDKSVIQ